MMERFQNNPDYPEDLFLTGDEAAARADANTMLVVVDVNRPSITEAPELLKMVKTIMVLDHHRQSSEIIENAVLSYVEPYASSTCEMVSEILLTGEPVIRFAGEPIRSKIAKMKSNSILKMNTSCRPKTFAQLVLSIK